MGLLSLPSSGAKNFEAYLSPAAAWALSIGTSIGWGSFVITSNNYLLKAGPLGSCLGMLAGMAVMLVVAYNYHYLMNRYPSAGGAYTYAKEAFGYDHGFLTAWFVSMTYLAILWANATSVPLFAQYFVGDVFKVGFCYSLFGYDVYLGEAVLTVGAIAVFGAICVAMKRLAARLMVGLAVAFCAGIALCFGASFGGMQGAGMSFSPAFAPNGNALMQVIMVACISPWAFIGFENISHMSEEFKFSQGLSFRVLAISVALTTGLYIFVILLSTTAYPPQFTSWFDYLSHLGDLRGIEALPPFYAAYHYLGDLGVNLLFIALFALIATSLIGNMTALSRLFYALAKDGILPKGALRLDKNATPVGAIAGIVAVSCVIPFLGRTAIGWIVDVTTIGATITYGFVSAAARKTAQVRQDSRHAAFGGVGLVLMVIMGAILVLPNLFTTSSMATESYFLFTVWAIAGLTFFWYFLRHDADNRFGESIIVWAVLLAFVLFMTCVWLEQSSERVAESALGDMQAYYESDAEAHGPMAAELAHYADVREEVHVANTRNMLIALGIFTVSLGLLISNYSYMRRRENENALQLGLERIRANTDELTGVRNKHAYAEVVRELEARLKGDPSLEFAIVLCDLNDLKRVNDTLGHPAGDAYIVDACKLICRTFKHSPVFRVGGDEFVAIAEGDDYRNRVALVEELDRQAEEGVEGGTMVVSVGMAEYRRGQDADVVDVYDRADRLMYERKRALKAKAADTARRDA